MKNKNNTNSLNWETMLIIVIVGFIAYIFAKSKWNLDNFFKNVFSLEWWKGLLKGNVTTNPTIGEVLTVLLLSLTQAVRLSELKNDCGCGES